MIHHIIIGIVLVGLTVFIHAVALDRMMTCIERLRHWFFFKFPRFWKVPVLIFTVCGVFLAIVAEILVWAIFFLLTDNFTTMEAAAYYSTSCFTTLGFGDVVLDEDWRLLSSFEGANGMILFGWSTAFIFEVMEKLYGGDFK
jgi:hypothetical protein